MKASRAAALLLIVAVPAPAQVRAHAVLNHPGLLRIWGSSQMEPVVRLWLQAYRARNPSARFETRFDGSDVAMAGLYTDKADIALLGREARPSEKQAFQWIFRYPVSAAEIMTGSAATAGRSPALAVLVHKSNPLRSIRIEQLRAVFATEGTTARSWGDLGLGGRWAKRPVRLYAPMSETGTGTLFRSMVLGGTNKLPWDRLTEFSEPVMNSRHVDGLGHDIAAALAKDPAGIAIGNVGDAGPHLRALAVSVEGPPVPLTADTVRDRSYPFARPVFAYVNREQAKRANPDIADFLAFVLSPQGQHIAERAGFLRRCEPASDVQSEILAQPYVPVPGPVLPPVPCGRSSSSASREVSR